MFILHGVRGGNRPFLTKRIDKFEATIILMTPMLPTSPMVPMLPVIDDARRLPPKVVCDLDQSRIPSPHLINDYDRIVIEAVGKSLEVLGQQGREVVLGLLESRYGFRLEDVLERPRSFIELLAMYLGPTAYVIERQITSEIRKTIPAKGESLQAVVNSLEDLDSTSPYV